jgi:predicted Fe-Mo cluster-binding NifX family protein
MEVERMRIAISLDENKGLESRISHHFGRCPYFAVVEVDGGEVGEVQVISNPYFADHQPGMVPEFIKEQGADVMISGGVGRRAIGFFEHYGIQAATGAAGTALDSLQRYLDGGLNQAAPCKESREHHRRHRGHH